MMFWNRSLFSKQLCRDLLCMIHVWCYLTRIWLACASTKDIQYSKHPKPIQYGTQRRLSKSFTNISRVDKWKSTSFIDVHRVPVYLKTKKKKKNNHGCYPLLLAALFCFLLTNVSTIKVKDVLRKLTKCVTKCVNNSARNSGSTISILKDIGFFFFKSVYIC